jgi:hypothetical protein
MNRSIWKFFTSLRLTIVLLGAAIILVFVGTVAQADEGLYQVQDRYFTHWYVLGTTLWGVKMPWFIWPGGRLVGSLLLVNLLAAHIKRFQWSTSKLGIHLTHLGIIILLAGQLASDLVKKESHMTLNEGQTGDYIERARSPELAFISDKSGQEEQVVAVPPELIAKGGTITDPNLPFTVRVKEYAGNGEVVSHQKALEAAVRLTTALATVDGEFSTPAGLVPQAERAEETPGRLNVWRAALEAIGEKEVQDVTATVKKVAAQPERASKLQTELKTRFREQMINGFTAQGGEMRLAAEKIAAGESITAESLPAASSQGAGAHATLLPLPEVKDMDTRSFPYAVLELEAGGKSLGTWLVSTMLREQPVQVGDKTVRVALREERQYLPYTIKLLHATHKVYPGSDTPKDFRSRVLIDNPVSKENRETEISMNDPLRYSGLAFYQYQMTKDEADRAPGQSVLQVVRNPSWLMPYIGCITVAAGMLWQFLHHLVGFINKRRPA